MTAEKEQHNAILRSNAILKEAEEKLSVAVKAGNLDEIAIAHGLLEIGRKRISEATTELAKLAVRREKCNAKKKRQLKEASGHDKGQIKSATERSKDKQQSSKISDSVKYHSKSSKRKQSCEQSTSKTHSIKKAKMGIDMSVVDAKNTKPLATDLAAEQLGAKEGSAKI